MKLIERLLFAVMASLFGVGAAAASTVANPTSSTERLASTVDADTAWSEAVNLGTLEAYADFAMRHPDSSHAQEAYDLLATGPGPDSEDQAALKSMAANSPTKRSDRSGIVSSFLYIV